MQAQDVRRYGKVERNTDLVRAILLAVEKNPEMDYNHEFFIGSPELTIAEYSTEQIGYHVTLLIEEGFLTGNPVVPSVTGLKWAGHEFLDSIKTQSIYEATKQRLAGLPSVTFKVFAAVAQAIGEAEIKRHLGLS
ncbi:MAG: DUF2513 domain-containing protein [Bryobacteraceae bacterium]|jgi:hypothetical protein